MTDTRRLQPTPAIPVIERIAVRLPEAEQSRLATAAERILDDEPELRRPTPPGVTVGSSGGPCLVVEDHSAIALFDWRDESAYAYRGLLLAGEGDVALVGSHRSPAFERYCRDVLELGNVVVEVVPGPARGRPRSLALRAAADRDLLGRVAAWARREDGLTLVPYMGSGAAWRLAGRIAAEADRPVRVAAPPPALVKRVNDKGWFAQRVVEVLGPQAAPPTETAPNLTMLAALASRFAGNHASIAVKLPDAASSSGNLVLDGAEVGRHSLRALAESLRQRLARLGWRGTFPLVVTAWEQPVLASPSVQMWIPDRQDGPPVIEGVFDQVVGGVAAAFNGAVSSLLPSGAQRRAAQEAARLGTLLQGLGYFGRCSLDAVLVGANHRNCALHWVECNGRWGGVSIPMTCANRLIAGQPAGRMAILDRFAPGGRGLPLQTFLDAAGDMLLRPKGAEHGAVLLSPSRIEEGRGYQVMMVDSSPAAALSRARELECRILQLLEVPSAEFRKSAD